MGSNAGVEAYLAPFFKFVDGALAAGHGVLIHCLAGAHRAGTAGVAYLMHVVPMRLAPALVAAKKLRPAINPIGLLVQVSAMNESRVRV